MGCSGWVTGKIGGPVGSIGEFGSSIAEMQDHITGLQKKSGYV
jgi:hypothetical protein